MNIREFYEKTDGDYDSIVSGLGKEERVFKYLMKFAQADVIDKISSALASGDYDTAFREAHNLKGMSLNIGIMSLQKAASDLTESLRHGPTGDVEGLFEIAAAEYKRCCEMIGQIEQ